MNVGARCPQAWRRRLDLVVTRSQTLGMPCNPSTENHINGNAETVQKAQKFFLRLACSFGFLIPSQKSWLRHWKGEDSLGLDR